VPPPLNPDDVRKRLEQVVSSHAAAISVKPNSPGTLAVLQRQSDAIESLRQSHAELAKKVATLQAESNRSIVGLLRGIEGLEQKLHAAKVQERALRAQNALARTRVRRQQRTIESMATTSQIHDVTAVVNSVQSAAFGERGSVFATNNLLLAGNQLLWLFLEPLLRGLGFALGPSPSLLTWLAPVGSLLTGQLVLGNRQHVRFVTGVVEFDGKTFEVSDSLEGKVADSFFTELKRRTDVPVTAVPLDPGISPSIIFARVREGVVIVNFSFGGLISSGTFPSGRVAWMVDTGVDGG
jgi:hypothetical protein